MSMYDSEDLYKTAKAYDQLLTQYLQEYKKAGIQAKHFLDIDAFISAYSDQL